MKRILISAGLILGAVSIYTPIAHAMPSDITGDYTIDCSTDSDLSTDNTDYIWIPVATEAVTTIRVINCEYSCAAGDVTDATTCGSAFHDGGVVRGYTLNGYGSIHGYTPGSYGQIISFVANDTDLGLKATPGPYSITFSWNQIPQLQAFAFSGRDPNEGPVRCDSHGTNSCTIGGLTPGAEIRFVMSNTWDFGYSSVQVRLKYAVITAAAGDPETSEPETLANTGFGFEPVALVAFIVLTFGFLASTACRRRPIGPRT